MMQKKDCHYLSARVMKNSHATTDLMKMIFFPGYFSPSSAPLRLIAKSYKRVAVMVAPTILHVFVVKIARHHRCNEMQNEEITKLAGLFDEGFVTRQAVKLYGKVRDQFHGVEHVVRALFALNLEEFSDEMLVNNHVTVVRGHILNNDIDAHRTFFHHNGKLQERAPVNVHNCRYVLNRFDKSLTVAFKTRFHYRTPATHFNILLCHNLFN
jgi:hypothetical protein